MGSVNQPLRKGGAGAGNWGTAQDVVCLPEGDVASDVVMVPAGDILLPNSSSKMIPASSRMALSAPSKMVTSSNSELLGQQGSSNQLDLSGNHSSEEELEEIITACKRPYRGRENKRKWNSDLSQSETSCESDAGGFEDPELRPHPRLPVEMRR